MVFRFSRKTRLNVAIRTGSFHLLLVTPVRKSENVFSSSFAPLSHRNDKARPWNKWNKRFWSLTPHTCLQYTVHKQTEHHQWWNSVPLCPYIGNIRVSQILWCTIRKGFYTTNFSQTVGSQTVASLKGTPLRVCSVASCCESPMRTVVNLAAARPFVPFSINVRQRPRPPI